MTLNREAFRLWLTAKEPDEVVGEGGRPMGCPLACFLREFSRDGIAHVNALYYRTTFARPPLALPRWAIAFLRAIDDRAAGLPIAAKDALEVLDSYEVAR